MADNKKISELNQIQSLNNDDEFVVVDKSTKNGTDAVMVVKPPVQLLLS